jgi:arylsulfatase A-like enzyme
MGFLSSKRGLTPNLDSLAHQAAVFARAYSQVPLTTPSHATMLTGTYPQFNHVSDLGSPLTKDLPYLPDILRQHGYRTAAFVGSQVLDPKSAAAPAFDRGFETYDAPFHIRGQGEGRYHSVERRGMMVVNRALAWLNQHPRGPFFLWLHFYDPHDPYDPPPPFKARYVASPYDGEIAYVDSAVGKLLTALRSHGLYDQSLIVVVADHGEAFGEHGERSHGLLLYDETLHVPLLIKLPGTGSAHPLIESRVGLIDIAPTLLQEVGIAAPAAMQGRSLLELMKPSASGAANTAKSDVAAQDRPQYAETDYPYRAFGWSSLRAWRAGKYLYIDAPERELYDQSLDPEASHNLVNSVPGVADTMAAQLEEFRRKTGRAGKAEVMITPRQAEQLRALGYVSSGSIKPERASKRKEDPTRKTRSRSPIYCTKLCWRRMRSTTARPFRFSNKYSKRSRKSLLPTCNWAVPGTAWKSSARLCPGYRRQLNSHRSRWRRTTNLERRWGKWVIGRDRRSSWKLQWVKTRVRTSCTSIWVRLMTKSTAPATQ